MTWPIWRWTLPAARMKSLVGSMSEGDDSNAVVQSGNCRAFAMHHKVVLPCGAWERQTADGANCSGACSTSVSWRS
jgi:hypothetical protein